MYFKTFTQVLLMGDFHFYQCYTNMVSLLSLAVGRLGTLQHWVKYRNNHVKFKYLEIGLE